jgi:predicted GTPase
MKTTKRKLIVISTIITLALAGTAVGIYFGVFHGASADDNKADHPSNPVEENKPAIPADEKEILLFEEDPSDFMNNVNCTKPLNILVTGFKWTGKSTLINNLYGLHGEISDDSSALVAIQEAGGSSCTLVNSEFQCDAFKNEGLPTMNVIDSQGYKEEQEMNRNISEKIANTTALYFGKRGLDAFLIVTQVQRLKTIDAETMHNFLDLFLHADAYKSMIFVLTYSDTLNRAQKIKVKKEFVEFFSEKSELLRDVMSKAQFVFSS